MSYVNAEEVIRELRLSIDEDGNITVAARDTAGNVITNDLLDALERDVVSTVSASGATRTLPDPIASGMSQVTLSASCTFTMPTPKAGLSFVLVLVQGTGGSRLAIFTDVYWAGGTAPTLSTAVGAIDVLSFMCVDGEHWLGFVGGLAMAAPA